MMAEMLNGRDIIYKQTTQTANNNGDMFHHQNRCFHTWENICRCNYEVYDFSRTEPNGNLSFSKIDSHLANEIFEAYAWIKKRQHRFTDVPLQKSEYFGKLRILIA